MIILHPFIKELCLFQYLLIYVGYSWQERLYVSSYTEYLIAMTFARPIGFPSNQQHSLLYLLVFDKGKYVIPLSYVQVLMIACAICISEKAIAPFGCRRRTSCTKVISIWFRVQDGVSIACSSGLSLRRKHPSPYPWGRCQLLPRKEQRSGRRPRDQPR